MRRIRDARLAGGTALVLVRCRYALWAKGLQGALAMFDLAPVRSVEQPLEASGWQAEARRVAQIAGRVLDYGPMRSTCLPTAVTLAHVLHRQGVAADVVVGVSAADGFSAHAWVELAEGRIDLSGHPLSAHTPMARFRYQRPAGVT